MRYPKEAWGQDQACVFKINYILALLEVVKAEILKCLQEFVYDILINMCFISAADEPREK
jgi:hypothetical protein